MQEGWLDPGFFHSALLTGLTPGSTYYYRFGGDAVGLSQVFLFAAAPEVGADTSVSILLIADMGQGEPDGSMEQSEMVPSLDTTRGLIHDAFSGESSEKNTPAAYQMVAHFGDISYARGHVSQWDRFTPTSSQFLFPDNTQMGTVTSPLRSFSTARIALWCMRNSTQSTNSFSPIISFDSRT